MNKCTVFLLGIFVCAVSVASASPVDDLAKSAVYIREKKQVYETINNKRYEVWLKDPITKIEEPKLITLGGTGFFISHNHKIYLVTAAHIAKQLTQRAEILLNIKSDGISIYTMKEIQAAITGSRWFIHPIADIAIHPFGFKTNEKADHILPSEKMYWDENKILSIGEKVYIFGYPLHLGVQEILSPLSKKAEVSSWLTTIDNPAVNPNLKCIFLDEDLAQGYSGAPVFRSPEPRMSNDSLIVGGGKLIGIQSMTISDNTGGKISLVIPILYLNEIFEQKEFKEYEKKLLLK